MGVDDRIRLLAREEIQRAADSIALGPGELVEGNGWADRTDDLHRELHVLATKLSVIQGRLSVLEEQLKTACPPPAAGPVTEQASALPTRAATSRPARKGSA